jgi:tetratricopeptide (TPR) repeat protein
MKKGKGNGAMSKSTLIVLVAIANLALAQRARPAFDPETKDGLLIQHIQQEDDPVEKLHYMEQFALQFPTHPGVAWVYDQMQPAYMKVKEWDQAMRIGEKRLALEPDNLDAVKLSLKAAESKNSQKDIATWADRSWTVSTLVMSKGGRRAADAAQTQLYAEYSFYSLAMQTPDPRTRLKMLQALEQRNPKSPYSENLPAECFTIYKQLGEMPKALALAEKTLAADPDNIDMLVAITEYHFNREEARDKVAASSARLIEILPGKARPATLSEDEWQKKKTHLTGMAQYMAGVVASLNSQFGRADALLRAALPVISNNPTQEATALFHLGIANYRLADQSPARAQDALRFSRRCAAIKSAFQAQAAKNAESIRVEFNLP